MNYAESKKKLDVIRREYSCAGDIIFRTAIQLVMERGKYSFLDESWCEDEINAIDDRHDSAESVGKILFMTRDLEKAIFECARELAKIEAYDLLTYIQREVWLGGGEVGEPDYQRAMEIIRDCLSYMAGCYGAYTYDNKETLEKSRCVMEDHEIEFFGWEELFDEEED